ncbi:hypothetical protein [Methylosinus sp. PW1]|uniref:beta strand repeat-containing protein n=1 Tax=Methylosinus sp. PW1 TaxID=107636 RepID=UPI00055ECC3E|nr:hypothetical protein [Methylosinus sp. PW1]
MSGTLTANQLCKTDGNDIICDSTTPTISGGNVGIGSTSPVSSLDLSQKTDAIALPGGSSAQRPTAVNGMIRYNTGGVGSLEAYLNGAWTTLLNGAGGGSAAGSNGQVQFNNGGVLGASSNFVWDNTNSNLSVSAFNTTPLKVSTSYGNPAILATAGNGAAVSATSSSNDGVYGVSTSGNGVHGSASNGTGVFGRGDNGYGVYGQSVYSYSGFFEAQWNNNTAATLVTQQNGTGTGDLFQALNSSGTVLANITASGRLGIGTPSPATLLDVNGAASLRLGTDYTTTGSQNNVSIGATSTVRYNGTAAATFTGIAAGANGQILYLHNPSSYTLTLSNQNASSSAANRIVTGTGADLPVPSNTSVTLQYDSTAALWRVTGSSNSGNTLAAGSTGQVQFNGGGSLGASSNFVWDNTNGRLGIGTTNPTSLLTVAGAAQFNYSSAAAEGIAVKPYSSGYGGHAISEISGTNSSVWTAGQGLIFRNDVAQASIGASLYGASSIGAKIGQFGTDGIGNISNAIWLTADSTNTYVTSMQYAGSPYPPLYISAPTINFNTVAGGGAWPNGNGGVSYGSTAMTITGAGAVGIGSATPAAGMKADIAGPVKVAGTGSEPCTAAQVGAIRYNPSGNYFELCSYP